ncbi:SH3 domain-containing protein [Altererythrobacter arenosus]|uniref:SH3 domain-containing protein n=2 Tax=Altererythrobacter arenosus TaxID=3032592 RepID=A0ABY8FQN6_9SPHN|nr:SH3 domain-containing protein [Altererythrobacter sp. CAU 1644]WFL77162.1 SH3 domain-containing protein [Altererythrobacter sp. CAU 1644]
MKHLSIFLACSCASLLAVPLTAQNRETPYWASIRASELNMRVGPSADYRIDWVYKRKGLPVKVVRVREGWRLIQDPDGTQGWVVARLLSPERSAIVIGDGLMPIREAPSASAKLKWNAEPGVVGMLGKCDGGWCEFNTDGHSGWVPADRLWGVGEP